MQYKNALIIFVRKPELGKVKTRLAAQIGRQKALQIYLKLLEHTKAVASKAVADSYIFTTENFQNFSWANSFNVVQSGNNLGEKMSNAFNLVLEKGYSKVVIIGSDCPGLSAVHLKEAFNKLSEYDTVIGPANDGGYYLLGMKKLHLHLFKEKNWSTSSVFEETKKDITALNLTCYELEILTDVDTASDIPPGWL